jgi:hypothetical protein
VRITLRSLKGAPGYLVTSDNQTVAFQTDWDWCGPASTFGWKIRDAQYDGVDCAHSSTDGTVTCGQCGMTPHKFIQHASNFLDANVGKVVEDPGYFS